ncbi:MAG TPA: ABC transporter permease [Vicinamibacterales bacterium]|nr:ABC transporter permease [Vicinamibacterales bacterium]
MIARAIAQTREQVRAGLLLATSYRLNFGLSVIGRFWWIVWVYFLAKLVPAARASSPEMARGYFAFALIGVAFQQYLSNLLVAGSEKVREDELNGLLPALLVTPAHPFVSLFGPALWSVVDRAATLVLMIAIGAWAVGLSFPGAHWGTALVIVLLATLSVAAWGILSACFTLVFKRGDPIVLLAGILGFVFSGAYFPIDILPPWMRVISAVYPHAYAISAVRRVLLDGASFHDVAGQVLALFGFAVILVPVAILSLHASLARVRKQGNAAHY